MININGSAPYILYIEDDAEDVELLKYTLTDTPFNFDIVHVWNGAEALNYLNELKHYRQLPSLILLDINMSKLNGKETLVCLRAHKDLTKIPVAVLSTSTEKSDKAYFKKFNVPYVVKPGSVDRFRQDLVGTMRKLVPLDFPEARNTDAA